MAIPMLKKLREHLQYVLIEKTQKSPYRLNPSHSAGAEHTLNTGYNIGWDMTPISSKSKNLSGPKGLIRH